MCYSVCAARPFMDQCIKARCFEYQTRLWLAPPAPLWRTDCTWSLSLPRTNRLPQKCLLPPGQPREALWCCLIAAPAALSWRSMQPAEARSVSSAPCAPTCKIYDCSETQKKSRDPVLSRRADIGFQIPYSYTPRHCSAV